MSTENHVQEGFEQALFKELGVSSEAEARDKIIASTEFIVKLCSLTAASTAEDALFAVRHNAAFAKQMMAELGVSSREEVLPAIQQLREAAEDAERILGEIQKLKSKQSSADREQLIGQLSMAGILPPALHNWARTQSVEELTEWAQHAPVYSFGGSRGKS